MRNVVVYEAYLSRERLRFSISHCSTTYIHRRFPYCWIVMSYLSFCRWVVLFSLFWMYGKVLYTPTRRCLHKPWCVWRVCRVIKLKKKTSSPKSVIFKFNGLYRVSYVHIFFDETLKTLCIEKTLIRLSLEFLVNMSRATLLQFTKIGRCI